jgi:beta-mannosidase
LKADAIATAIEAHRKNIPVTMGTLFWQWNDCWPVVSWSAVDYYGRKKALAYQLKRLFASLFIAAEKNERGLNVSIISDSLKAFKADIVIDYYDISGQKKGLPLVLYNQLIRPGVNNIFFIPDSYSKNLNNNLICRIGAWKGKKQLASLCYLPGSPKDLKLEKPVITIRQINNKEIELSVNKFAYGVYIETPFSINTDDNYFHLLPGEKKRIRFSGIITGAAIQSLKIRSLADTY